MSDSAHLGGAGLPDVNDGARIIIATSIVTGFAFLTVLARVYVRAVVIQNMGSDDYMMLLTMLLSLSGLAIIIPEVIYGAGRHTVYVENTATLAMQLNFATQAIYMWAIGLVKISIGLFLLRFAPRRSYRILIWAIIVLMALYTTICFFTLIFQCKDIRSIWDTSVKSKCFSGTQLLELSYTNTALNILTDLIFALLPAFMLRHLQVNRRVKASLVCILGLGVFACAAAFIKLSILPSYGRTGDFLWDYTDLTIWVVVECNTGIIAGSLPTLKPLFKQVLGSYGSNSQSHQYLSGTDRYKMRSMSRSRPGKSQALSSGNLSVVNHDKGLRSSKNGSTIIATYPGLEGNNSSEERILDHQAIICTTEVEISRTQESSPVRGSRRV